MLDSVASRLSCAFAMSFAETEFNQQNHINANISHVHATSSYRCLAIVLTFSDEIQFGPLFLLLFSKFQDKSTFCRFLMTLLSFFLCVYVVWRFCELFFLSVTS